MRVELEIDEPKHPIEYFKDLEYVFPSIVPFPEKLDPNDWYDLVKECLVHDEGLYGIFEATIDDHCPVYEQIKDLHDGNKHLKIDVEIRTPHFTITETDTLKLGGNRINDRYTAWIEGFELFGIVFVWDRDDTNAEYSQPREVVLFNSEEQLCSVLEKYDL